MTKLKQIRRGYCPRCHQVKQVEEIKLHQGKMWLCSQCQTNQHFDNLCRIAAYFGVTKEEFLTTIKVLITHKLQDERNNDIR